MDIESLINGASRERPHICVGKYVKTVGGDAEKYFKAIEQKEKEVPGSINRTEVGRILDAHFGIKNVGRDAVSRHFQNLCACKGDK